MSIIFQARYEKNPAGCDTGDSKETNIRNETGNTLSICRGLPIDFNAWFISPANG